MRRHLDSQPSAPALPLLVFLLLVCAAVLAAGPGAAGGQEPVEPAEPAAAEEAASPGKPAPPDEAAADEDPERAPRDAEPDVPVSDIDIGLVRASVFDDPTPPAVRYNESFPGERPSLGRMQPEGPPPVPHGVADFLPITREDNMCTACHLPAAEMDEPGEGDPTPIPESHYVDLREAPQTVRDELAGARWVCTACHVAQTDNPPLVDNRMTGAEPEGEHEPQ